MELKCKECHTAVPHGIRTRERICAACRLVKRRAAFSKRVKTFGSSDWAGRRLYHTRVRAFQRGIEYTLTRRDIQQLASSHRCFYCKVKKGIFTLERVNNDIGYIPGNVVYACWPCNSFKSNIFSGQEMMVLGPAFRKVRAMRGHDESDYYLLGIGNAIKWAARRFSRPRTPITRTSSRRGRPPKDATSPFVQHDTIQSASPSTP